MCIRDSDARDAAGYAPASCPGVISVGATDDAGARASFSNLSLIHISEPTRLSQKKQNHMS
ncbi:hypothetical protein AERO_18640 [Aeromicrobium fastidiosum]|uniref:hypothetical protein n=1 Tax=Aeromicrobium fastidiosum TaxID=52699 RepID=UPI002023262A|nr:hypothetical protein [Aeromicrobium fastidiosum]MCL8253402.1 hypothetical protein [Aeromicrobium fastidiosum]